MRNLFLPALIACAQTLLPLNGQAQGRDQAILTRAGKPLAVIVIPDAAGRAEHFAAAELQKYLEKISGARLEIIPEGQMAVDKQLGPDSSRIFIGQTKASRTLRNLLRRKDADAFAVKIERQQIGEFVRPGQWDDRPGTWHDVFLAGAGDRGTVYAVYDFLERELGCRWLAPGERWEEIPPQAEIAVPIKTRMEEPGLKYRQDNSLDSSDWGMKLKANVGRRICWPFAWMDERYREAAQLPFELRGWEAVHDAPRIVWGVSTEHPEWFALDQNQARPVGGAEDRHKGQLCFSNPEVHDLLAERLSQLFRERPELEFVEVGCADGLPANYCQCERCLEWDALGDPSRLGGKSGMHTHRWLALVNAVAARLAESDPGKQLVAAAYSSYQEPPDPAVIKPAENVVIMYWTWSNCRMHGYEHAGEDETRLPEMASHELSRQWIDAWRAITPAGMYMSEYVSRSAMDGIVGANSRRYVADMRWLKARGFIGYNAFDGPIPWGMQIVNRYAILKAMWNPAVDAEALTEDFCGQAFHAAAGHMLKFYAAIADAMQKSGCSHVAATSWVQPAAVAEARTHLTNALAAAAGDEPALLRLREIDWHFQYTALAGAACELWFRVVRGERDPALMREAIRLGEAALAYMRETTEQYPEERFYAGWRMRNNSLGRNKNGSWFRLLGQLEAETDK